MTIIKAEPLNLELLAELEQGVFGNTTRSSIAKMRIGSAPYLFLVAYENGSPAGFKLGYERPPGSHWFYSWIGGVLPQYRRRGLARRLMEEQHRWARSQGYAFCYFKTFEEFAAMRALAEKMGYRLMATGRDPSRGKSYLYAYPLMGNKVYEKPPVNL